MQPIENARSSLCLGQNTVNGLPIKAMVVDDTKVIRMVLKQLLLAEKFEVIMEAENGEEAIRMLSQAAERPDILFIDKEMPVLDGISTIRELRPLFPNMKIVMVTSIKDEETVKEAIKIGITGYIVKPGSDKPFERKEFLERLAKFLGRDDYCSKYVTT
jgi:DNA-binding NarL/FixJ family response regulator